MDTAVRTLASQVALVVKNPPASARDVRDTGSTPGWGRSPGEGDGNPLQYSCLENPIDRGAWWATVRGVAESRTRLKQLSTQSISTLKTSARATEPRGLLPAFRKSENCHPPGQEPEKILSAGKSQGVTETRR